MSLGLKWKLILITGIPSIAFALMAGLGIIKNLTLIQETKVTEQSAAILQATSELLDQIQKERARTVAFLGGAGVALGELIDQQRLVDTKIESFRTQLPMDRSTLKDLDLALGKIEALRQTRERINERRLEKRDAIALFNESTITLLTFQAGLADISRTVGIPALIRSINAIDWAKENGGRLRANMVDILSADKAISESHLKLIISLKETMIAYLNSPFLTISPTSRDAIANLFLSQQWQKVNAAHDLVVKRAYTGDFEQDPHAFLEQITAAIDELVPVISREENAVKQIVGMTLQNATRDLQTLLVLTFFVTLLIAGAVWYFTQSISRPILNAVQEMESSANHVSATAQELYSSSVKIKSDAADSSVALQETIATLDFISNMIIRSLDSSQNAHTLSRTSGDDANTGRKVSEQMITAMSDIDTCSSNIMSATNENGKKFANIVNVIREIAAKTQIVNDIAFQTKLLSFNASVEASRAGAHGKGFLVVAEEIGKLAEVSGGSATQISAMLASSLEVVESTIAESTVSIEKLMEENRQKIEVGVSVADECRNALDRISSGISSVIEKLAEISTASSEQSTAVQQISSATGRLENATASNVTSAEQATLAATHLEQQSRTLLAIMSDLSSSVLGTAAENITETRKTITREGAITQGHQEPTPSTLNGPASSMQEAA